LIRSTLTAIPALISDAIDERTTSTASEMRRLENESAGLIGIFQPVLHSLNTRDPDLNRQLTLFVNALTLYIDSSQTVCSQEILSEIKSKIHSLFVS
jgi:hypothetical protein